MESNGGREVYVVGHLEYEPLTLHKEYLRDLEKGATIAPPEHYYSSATPDSTAVPYTWEGACRQFFRNWLVCCKALWQTINWRTKQEQSANLFAYAMQGGGQGRKAGLTLR